MLQSLHIKWLNPTRLFDFALLDSIFKICHGLLLRVHGVSHPRDQKLLTLCCGLKSSIVLILHKRIRYGLIIVPTFVFIESVRFQCAIHLLQTYFLGLLPLILFTKTESIFLNYLVLFLEAILPLSPCLLIICLVLCQDLLFHVSILLPHLGLGLHVLYLLLLGFPLLLRPELLHLLVPSVLFLAYGIHLLSLSHGLSDFLIHSLFFLLQDLDSILNQLRLLVHCLALILLVKK